MRVRPSLRRAGAIVTMATLFVLGVSTAAYARYGNGPVDIGNEYARFVGNIYWYPNGVNHGGMDVYGTLYDINCDNNSVKVQGRVSGYGYTTLWTVSGCGNSAYGDKVVYDPQATQVNTGYVRTCRYNGWGTDKCIEEYMHR